MISARFYTIPPRRRNDTVPDRPRILDNETATVADHLLPYLRAAAAFDFVSAYFTIYGYELLAEELESVPAVRFLFGDPASVEQLDPGAAEPKSFELTEAGLAPNHTLQQRQLARRCAAWAARPGVDIRSVRQSGFLHGKLYLTAGSDGADGAGSDGAAAVVGSSNFTRRGLGGSNRPNLEINLAADDAATLSELRAWFNRLWRNARRTGDVKQQVLDALARIGQDYAPERVYYKTLYELFRQDIEALREGDADLAAAGFTVSQIWNALYEFQKDGVRSVIVKMRKHHGCILADSVGLGKTYTALAVIKYFELRNERVLVLCPKKLQENWSLYQAANGHIQNPFAGDRLGYTLLAHTDLSRDSGIAGSIDLANFNWAGYDLVVIDESHNFRNDDGQRYRRLLDEVIASGARTKVLLLSATPVNTSLVDLRNQIYLMTEKREDAFQQSLGVGSIRSVMAAAQKQFREWETTPQRRGRRDKTQLLDNLGADFLRLLDGVSIARSRRLVEQFYAAEMERIGQFPEHAAPVNAHPPTDLAGSLSYTDLAERIGEFRLAVYQPSAYVTDPARLAELAAARQRYNFNQQDSEHYLIAMMRTNFLKRLESSAHSLTLTLQRTIAKIDDLLARIDRYERGGRRSTANRAAANRAAADLLGAAVLPDDDEDDEEFFVNRGRHPYRLSELDLPRWAADLRQDRDTLSAALAQVAAVTPARDGKLAEIKDAIRRKVQRPTADRDGNPNRKLLVFTTFKDTALYLYDNLAGLAAELGIKMAMVSGDETRAGAGAADFNAILSNFAPVARNRRTDASAGADAGSADIDLLIATDCISEGQNLQDCDTVINYDIHWNPVRIIQRFGRIDRIGSRSPAVRMVNYWPTADMDAYLKLQSRVQARMALADIAASGDADPFDAGRYTEADAAAEITFRNEQLRRLRIETPTIEELDDRPTMGDFTLAHFIAQLLRYLERNREELEAMPAGVYAVAGADADAAPGVIFCLRQRNAGPDAGAAADRSAAARRRTASPRHPFYFVYILDDGVIRLGCANLQQTLAVFEAAAGKTAPLTALCDRFDRETEQGRNMAFYDRLLTDAIAHIVQAHAGAQLDGLALGGDRSFTLAPAAETPRSASDFELLTWLVIKEPTA